MSAQRSVYLALVAGALAMALAACGGGTNTPSAAAGPTTTRPATPNRGGPPPGTFGTAAAVTSTNVEVQNPQNGQVTVNFTASTTFTDTVPATLADVTVGSCVTVAAASGGTQAKALTARTVTVTAPTNGACTGGGGFGGGGGGGGGAPGTTRTPNPSRPRPSGANGAPANFGAAFGSVTAASPTGFTVQGIARGTTPAVTTVVTVNSTTTYTKTAAATSSALAVGDCVTAIGAADDTGAVAATRINISKPGPTGCTAGLGRFRGGAGGAGAGQGAGTGTGTGGGNG
jgi:hypothetical protein